MFMMHSLQFFDCKKHLAYLIRLGFAFIVLDIDSWIAGPRRFKNHVTGARLTRFAKVRLANFLEVAKANVCRFVAHFVEDFFINRHVAMVSIMEPQLKMAKLPI
jgi:hypothetical protein